MPFRNRIVKYGVKPADQFTAHPSNARLHPALQRQAVKSSIETIGIIAPVIESAFSGYLIDGHERVWEALDQDPIAELPYVVLDFETEAEEHYALTVYDATTNLATYDAERLALLLEDVNSDDSAIRQMIAGLQEKALPEMPDRGAPGENGFNYQNQFGVIVTCESEKHQAEVYGKLLEMGYEVKVVVV